MPVKQRQVSNTKTMSENCNLFYDHELTAASDFFIIDC